jgi:hypothetical protein
LFKDFGEILSLGWIVVLTSKFGMNQTDMVIFPVGVLMIPQLDVLLVLVLKKR